MDAIIRTQSLLPGNGIVICERLYKNVKCCNILLAHCNSLLCIERINNTTWYTFTYTSQGTWTEWSDTVLSCSMNLVTEHKMPLIHN